MKSALATMVIVTAVLALVAGGFAMATMGAGNHTNCLAAIPGSPECVNGMSPIQFVEMHINTLLGASLGIVGSLAFSFFALLVAFMWLTISAATDPLFMVSRRLSIISNARASGIGKQRHWISLLEKRDPSLLCAMNA